MREGKRLRRRLLTLGVLVLCLGVFASSERPASADYASCFAACEQERIACEAWCQGCPYPGSEPQTYPSESYWWRMNYVTCADCPWGACMDNSQYCSMECF